MKRNPYVFGIERLERRQLLSSYTITDLGEVNATTLNDNGAVVGTVNNQGFLWSNGKMQTVGSFPPGTTWGADGINDAGQIVSGFRASDCDWPLADEPPLPAAVLRRVRGLPDLAVQRTPCEQFRRHGGVPHPVAIDAREHPAPAARRRPAQPALDVPARWRVGCRRRSGAAAPAAHSAGD